MKILVTGVAGFLGSHLAEKLSLLKHEVVGIFRRGGFSSTIPYRKMFVEELAIRYNNGQSIILLLILGIYKILNYWKKKIVK